MARSWRPPDRISEVSGERWVLVTDDVNGQNRAAVATVRALFLGGYLPAVSTCGRRSVAAASRYCARRVLLPQAGQPGYPQALRRERESGRYVSVLPASDVAVLALGGPEAGLVDKVVLSRRAQDAGIPTLPSRAFRSSTELREAADGLSYPLVVKAVVKSGRGDFQARRISSPAQLRAVEAPVPLLVQPFVTDPLRAVAGVVWDGTFLALSHQRYHRLWPRQAGVGSAAETVPPDLALEEPLLSLLSQHNGVFQAQFVGPYLLDVNPRVFGSVSLAVAAGANLPVLACDAARGQRAPFVRARHGVRYRWTEGDLRHLGQGVRSGDLSAVAALRELRPRRGTVHSIESLTDPAPGLVRLSAITHRTSR